MRYAKIEVVLGHLLQEKYFGNSSPNKSLSLKSCTSGPQKLFVQIHRFRIFQTKRKSPWHGGFRKA